MGGWLKTRRRAIEWLTVTWCAALLAVPAKGEDSDSRGLPLSSVINDFCRKHGFQTIYSSALSNGLTTRPLPPGISLEAGLDLALIETGRTWEYVNDHTVTIVRVEPVIDVSEPAGFELHESIVTGSHIRSQNALGNAVV